MVFCCITPGPPLQGRGGVRRGRMGERMKLKGMGPHFFIQVHAYAMVVTRFIFFVSTRDVFSEFWSGIKYRYN